VRISPRAVPRLQLLAAAALFSTGGAAIKATTLTGWQVASLRSAIAVPALLLMVPSARRGWSWRTLLVGVPYAATLILYVTATKLTTSANAIFLESTAPLYLLLLSPWLLRERIHASDLWFMAAVAVGLGLVVAGTDTPQATAPNPALGNLLGTLSGVAWALTMVGLRWLGGRSEEGGEALSTVVAGNAIAALVILPLALPIRGAGWADWLSLSYLGVVQVGLAYVCLTAGLRRVPALEASVLLLGDPALNPLWVWLAHGERPGRWGLAGGAVILLATAVRTWASARPPAPSAPVATAVPD
jgi:drug/metabolite transporter (DMT)-like permease